jgi:nucleoid-associated protein YgaU
MALLNRPFSVPTALAAALLLAGCSSARIDPLEFDYYATDGGPVEASAQPIVSRRSERDPVVPIHDAAALPSTPVARTHRIQKGESLYALSRRYLGAGKRWREIAQLNGLDDRGVRRLPVGRVIKIPAR